MPAHYRRQTQEPTAQAAGKSGWDKAAVLVQAVGGFAIFISLAALFVGIRQFNEQQRASAAQLRNQERQATLDQYLSNMGTLVLDHHLSSPRSGAAVRAIAVARTFTAVRNLDGERKGTLVRFLWEAGLINRPQPILNLFHADLNGTVFEEANLGKVYLAHLGLTKANFAGADLRGAYLRGSVLIAANLAGASLSCYGASPCTDLYGAYLMRANLTRADLTGADLSHAYLDGANLSSANLTGADLQHANYNSRAILVKNQQGQFVTDMPTRWPKGFNPRAHGARCGRFCLSSG